MTFDRHRVHLSATCRFKDGVAIIAVGLVTPTIGAHITRVNQFHLMAQRQNQTPPVMGGATGFHQPLDRLGLLLYITPKRHSAQPPALCHLAGTDTLGNLVNGLGKIHRDTLHFGPPAIFVCPTVQGSVVQGESITAFNTVRSAHWTCKSCAFARLLASR